MRSTSRNEAAREHCGSKVQSIFGHESEAVARQVGIERVFAEVLPLDKADGVRQH